MLFQMILRTEHMSNMWEVQVHHTTVEISSRFLLGTRKSGNGCTHMGRCGSRGPRVPRSRQPVQIRQSFMRLGKSESRSMTSCLVWQGQWFSSLDFVRESGRWEFVFCHQSPVGTYCISISNRAAESTQSRPSKFLWRKQQANYQENKKSSS